MIDWHRLFGLALTDFFADSPFAVELEKDLSLKRQMLDVVILRRKDGKMEEELPDGLENLADHNLLSYKSLREPFDDWALKELTGHYVNYRKQVSPSFDNLLPEEQFGLYGVSTRFPQKLSSQMPIHQLRQGVYDIIRGTDKICLIVLSEITEKKNNAIWQLFSGITEKVKFATEQYRKHTTDISTIICQLFEKYKLEGINMPYTMEDFRKDFVMNHLDILSPEDVLKRYSPEDVLKRYSPEDVLKRYSPEDRLKGLSPQELLKVIPLEEIKTYLKQNQS
jgi:hypothetical protein